MNYVSKSLVAFALLCATACGQSFTATSAYMFAHVDNGYTQDTKSANTTPNGFLAEATNFPLVADTVMSTPSAGEMSEDGTTSAMNYHFPIKDITCYSYGYQELQANASGTCEYKVQGEVVLTDSGTNAGYTHFSSWDDGTYFVLLQWDPSMGNFIDVTLKSAAGQYSWNEPLNVSGNVKWLEWDISWNISVVGGETYSLFVETSSHEVSTGHNQVSFEHRSRVH